MHADDGPAGNPNSAGDTDRHVRNSEIECRDIPADFYINKVYIVDYPVEYQTGGVRLIPKANTEIMNQLNLVGNTMYIFNGHGSRNTLSHERTFTRDMLPQLNNTDKFFFFAAFSCEVGRFDNHIGTLSSDMILLPKTGAIASFAASRVSYDNPNTLVASALMRNLLIKNSNYKYNTIGEASRLARRDGNSDEYFMYILMGDPSLNLVHPELNIKISEINGEIADKNAEPIELKGLSYLNLKGRIIDEFDNSTQADFNGTINIMLNEPKIDATVIDEFGTKFNFIKNGATLSSSIFKVENGEFDANLMIPGDISFSPKKSILYLYATDGKKQFAKDIYDNIIINDIEGIEAPDTNGPAITIKLDSRLFKSGDTVSRNPLLMVHI
jgi:hypothetical protein